MPFNGCLELPSRFLKSLRYESRYITPQPSNWIAISRSALSRGWAVLSYPDALFSRDI